MSNQDWEKFGEDIRRTVQDAVDSQDFNRLNQTITNTINNAMNGLGKSLHNVGDAVDKTAQSFKYQNRPYGRMGRGRDRYRYRGRQKDIFDSGDVYHDGDPYRDEHIYQEQDAYQGKDAFQDDKIYKEQDGPRGSVYSVNQKAAQLQKNDKLFMRTSGAKAGGAVMAISGYTIGIAMFLFLAFLLLGIVVSDTFGAGLLILAGVLGSLMLGGGFLAGIGTSLLGRVKRFRLYISELEGKEYCEIKELAESAGKSYKYVVKDIEKMIRRGWFRQGHLDRQKTCFIASNDAFVQYNELMERVEKQKLEEKLTQERQAKEQENIDPQVQEIIRTGDEYIKRIHESNDAIPGEEISAKITRMEVLVDRIFDRVEQNPENITDIRRLMEYYLPTTVKLLDAYQELDAMPVQGENILSSKKEIEKTLDTLNLAFEKLLDSLFQDTAWNVSADISVLNTMLAQEGLTKDDFK